MTEENTPTPPPSDGISPINIVDEMKTSYLDYAMSVIVSRALPDVRDGLKPVHRRILYSAFESGYVAGRPYRKSARIVGDVMGKYHPHGDSSIYDALARMTQDWSMSVPLVDGQGNFGSMDPDPPAAMRYTESRLAKVANTLLGDLDKDTVDFQPNYDGSESEPTVLPARYPNLLVNGAGGIAVGMATNIPPHNAAEVIDAALVLIENPRAELTELLDHVKGPDFPTGGIVVDSPETIAHAYATGRGGFRVRARFSTGKAESGWEDTGIEKQAGGTWQLVISEIPYGVAKGKLIEQIAQLIADKKLPILEDVRDESAEDLRIVLVPKSRNVDPDVLKESLYRLTDLESRFALNLNVLDATRTPKVMGLHQLLTEWLQHQIVVLVRRAQHRIAKIDDRLELVAGYIIAFLNLDRIIEIIRTEDEPKPVMIAEFILTDRQAEAILNMRLRSLRRLEEMELKREQADLTAEREELTKLVESPARQKTRLRKDLEKLRAVYGLDTLLGARRTTIAEAAPARDIPLDAMIEKEPVTVILSKRGWIRAQRAHVAADQWGEFKFKEGDELAFAVHAQTTDKLLIAASDGRFYTIGADKLPGGRGFGEPLRLMVDIDPDARIVALIPASADGRLLLASTSGHGFVAQMGEIIAETRKGRNVVNLKPKAQLGVVRPIGAGDDSVAVVGENRKLVVFPLAEVPVMARGQGVMLQRYRDGGLSDAVAFAFADGLSWAMGGDTGRTRTETDLAPWRVARGAAGRMPPTGFPRNNRFG
ncbi:MAG: DNA topoisomerase IV subunit A [Sphingopyxis sp.]